MRRADRVICISKSTRDDLVSILGIPEEKISVTYLGPSNLCQLAATETQVGSAPGTLRPSPFFLYVGRRGGYKNFARVLKAFGSSARLSGEFQIVCFGDVPFNDAERALMGRLSLPTESVVHVQGGDDILAAYYQAAVALIYPSLCEGFGIPPLEAMALDCPVLCSNTSAIPEVVGDAGMYFDPCDVDSIRAAILQIVDSENLRDELVRKGRARCKLFSWERCANETLQAYRTIA